jgi:hypothetical protein
VSAGNHQVKVVSEAISRAQVALDNLGLDYVIIVAGLDDTFSNNPQYARHLVKDMAELMEKYREKELDYKGERFADSQEWPRKDD